MAHLKVKLFILLVYLLAAACHGRQQEAYSWKPVSPAAIPSVAIIGTAKAGTTDMYTLLTKTSYVATGQMHKRTKEAKLLVEDGRTVKPGHADFHEYLLRIGHPCASSTDPQHGNNDAFKQCMQQLAANPATESTTFKSSSSSSSSSSSDDLGLLGDAERSQAGSQSHIHKESLPLSIDATPIYLALPQAIPALKAISNDTKVIVMLRHPVDRAESLYNHRVHTEVNHQLPVRVMNHTISQWANMFLDWVETTPGVKPLLEALVKETAPDRQAQLYQELVALNIIGLPEGQLTFRNYNLRGHIERNIFGTALYGAALAAWRAHYFLPGRVMVVDSHRFFARRVEVMNEVYGFIHGHALSEAGTRIAQRTDIQNARRSRGVEFAGASLDSGTRQRVQEFYQPHIDLFVNSVLPGMQLEGAKVLGFDTPPWVSMQQH